MATDSVGLSAVEDPAHVHVFHVTVLHLLGSDHTLLTCFHGGRVVRFTDVQGQVVRDLLA